MADLLTHVLVVYVAGTVLSWRTERVPERYVPVAMLGAIVPDLSKGRLLFSLDPLETALGLPLSWLAFHRLGPALVVALGLSLVFVAEVRRRVVVALWLGIASHFPLDLLVKRASLRAPPYLFPLSWWNPPALNVYLSSDRWMAVVSAVAACAVWLADRRGTSADRRRETSTSDGN